MKIRQEHGAVAMIIDPCQVPTVAAKAFVPATKMRGARGVVNERRRIQTPEVSEREWQKGGTRKLGAVARGMGVNR